VGRADGATAHHDLVALDDEAFPTALHLDPDGPLAVKHETTGHDVGLDGEVQPVASRV
jgi:hypothetical protein